MRKSESWWCSSRISTGHWIQGPSNNLAFRLSKDADWCIPMIVLSLHFNVLLLRSARPDSRTSSSRPRTDCRRVSYCGRFPVAVCIEKSTTWAWVKPSADALDGITPTRAFPSCSSWAIWLQQGHWRWPELIFSQSGGTKFFLRRIWRLSESSWLSRLPEKGRWAW